MAEKHSTWKTYVEYVDVETGEILTKYQVKARKYIIGEVINKEHDKYNKYTKFTRKVERDRQRKLF